jgi:flagellar biosynthesis/type III secretory pathway chaperone
MPNPHLPATPQAGRAARHDLITALVELLEREQSELIAPRADALEALAQKKQALCQALQPAVTGGRARSSATTDDAQTRTLFARAQRLNASNAAILAMHRASCEGRLRVLRGDNAATLYRANGYLKF